MHKDIVPIMEVYTETTRTVVRLKLWARMKDVLKISDDYRKTFDYEYYKMLDNIHTSIAESVERGKQ